MFRKLILIVGILGALAAAEGLNRFGGLVAAMGGADAPLYVGMLVVSVIGAGVLLLGLVGKSNRAVKWITFAALIGCIALMANAPGFPVSVQIIFGLIVAAGALRAPQCLRPFSLRRRDGAAAKGATTVARNGRQGSLTTKIVPLLSDTHLPRSH